MLKYLQRGIKESDKVKDVKSSDAKSEPKTRSDLRRLILRSPAWRGRSAELLGGARWLPDLTTKELVEVAKLLDIAVPAGFLKAAETKTSTGKKDGGAKGGKAAAGNAGSSKGAVSSKAAAGSSKAGASSSKQTKEPAKSAGESSKAAGGKRKAGRLAPGTYCIGGCGPENNFSNAFVYKILDVYKETAEDGSVEEVAKCLWFREQQVEATKGEEGTPSKRKGKRSGNEEGDEEDEGASNDVEGTPSKKGKARTRTLFVADPETQVECLDALTEMDGVREGVDEATGLPVAQFSRKAFYELLKNLKSKHAAHQKKQKS
eukprot:tig00000383_g24704.t1